MSLAHRLRIALERGKARDVDLIHHDSNVGLRSGAKIAAAVLVAVTDRAEPGVILTQRPKTMRKHPGQVAFPGGRMDESDADLIAAALREAEEEVGLFASQLEIVGMLDVYRTITDYEVTPIIAVARPDLSLVANEGEVEAIFEVPLSFLLDSRNHQTKKVIYEGLDREYYEIFWEDRRIWGATAAMIVNLSKRITWPL